MYPTTEDLDRAERCVRDEGNDHYFYIDPNQFIADDERSEMAAFDPEVDLRIETEDEAREVAQRLANFLQYRVVVKKYVQCGALRDNFEEDESERITVMPWSN
jgi:hypothetical protein